MNPFGSARLSQLYPQINRIKSKQPFYTNFYTYFNIPYKVIDGKNTILLLREEKAILRIYFFSNDLEELQELILSLKHNKNICIEILQKQEEILFNKLHIQAIYTHLRKSVVKNISNTSIPTSSINPKTLQSYLYRDFNYHLDHLPSIKTIRKWVKNSQILVIKDRNSLLSYLIFTIKGKSAYLNFIANHHDKTSLLEIWKHFYQNLNALEVKSLHLWCDSNNAKAINMYNIEGFLPDGLKNFIYLKPAFSSMGGGAKKKLDFTHLLEACA